ncbi:hypothetical protein [Collinsella sp. An2]|uniref:hypothetical protein n=1 Tax=Collinsella sp. An2 TaxID=1965585 RepID=UPI0013026A57|nr:hypothetical protein [Collinsella sp. An2]
MSTPTTLKLFIRDLQVGKYHMIALACATCILSVFGVLSYLYATNLALQLMPSGFTSHVNHDAWSNLWLFGCNPASNQPDLPFSMPTSWIGMHLLFVALPISYVTTDYRRSGIQILTRTSRKTSWYLAKLLWTILAIMLALMAALIPLLSQPSIAEILFEPTRLPAYASAAILSTSLSILVTQGSWQLGAIPTLLAYTIYLGVCAYLPSDNPLFIGSLTMLCRYRAYIGEMPIACIETSAALALLVISTLVCVLASKRDVIPGPLGECR